METIRKNKELVVGGIEQILGIYLVRSHNNNFQPKTTESVRLCGGRSRESGFSLSRRDSRSRSSVGRNQDGISVHASHNGVVLLCVPTCRLISDEL